MGSFHPESPQRILAIKEVLDQTDVGKKSIKIPARPATKEEIAWVHHETYINKIEETKGKTVVMDPDTTACAKTWEAALMAVGGTLEAVKSVMDGKVDNAFVFPRPPGHHAERAQAMGFCFFNNVAIAAEYAIHKYSLKKVAIVDFDVHHGNGTQNAFYDRKDVLYYSTHRWPFYPGSGNRDEHGQGGGSGYTVNEPLADETDDEIFRDRYENVVMPVLREFCPELLLISAGYDAHELDPLGGLRVSTETFNWVTEKFVEVAKECCEGRLVMVLEGGYSIDALKACAEGALRVLEG